MNAELRLLLKLSRSLPGIRGSGKLASVLTGFYNRKSRPDVQTDVFGCQMLLTPSEALDGQLLFCPQMYERPEMAQLRRYLRAGHIFLDAGSNIGFYSLVASQIVGHSGKVLAIEADRTNFERFRTNLKLNASENVIARNIGLSDKAEVLRLGLNLSGNRGGHTFLTPGDGGEMVQCAPLLDVIQEAGLDRIDAAKFDIEGFEFRVLEAFFLAKPPPQLVPRFIIIEQNRLLKEKAGDALELLRREGFSVSKLKDQNYLAVRE
jgi:FkbM family methyltransferase